MKLAIDFEPLESVTANEFKNKDIGTVISSLLNIIFPIAGSLLLLYLIIGGYQFMLSRGDPKALQDAKAKITYALVGFIIVFVAYWIVRLLGEILGIPDIISIFG